MVFVGCPEGLQCPGIVLNCIISAGSPDTGNEEGPVGSSKEFSARASLFPVIPLPEYCILSGFKQLRGNSSNWKTASHFKIAFLHSAQSGISLTVKIPF